MVNKVPYLKCEIIDKSLLGGVAIKFESVYIGYPEKDSCIVDKSQVKNIEGNSALIKLVGGVSELTKEKKEKDSNIPNNLNENNYYFIKLRSILEQGWAHFLVPKENIVYLKD